MLSRNSTDRRSFVGRLTGLSALALVSPATLVADEVESAAAPPWDLTWLDHLTGKHKQVFDLGRRAIGGDGVDVVGGDTPLRVVRNYMNAHKEVYGLEYPAVNTVVGITSEAFPINASDAIWLKYSLGERWKVKDSTTGTWAVRNVFADATKPINDRAVSVQALQKRGTLFWQCNNALNGVVAMLAPLMKMEVPAVREELIAGFMPGVQLVPAHTMALGLVQERGCTYESL